MKYIIIIGLLIICLFSKAQDYNQAVGIRGGVFSGVSYKIFKTEQMSYEGIVSTNYGGIRFVGLKQLSKPTLTQYSDKIFFIHGFGGHAGFYSNYRINHFLTPVSMRSRQSLNYVVIGMDAFFGLEYRVIKYPVTFGLEIIPFFDLFGPNYFNMNLGDLALSVKYTF